MSTLIEQVQVILAPLAVGGSWYSVNTLTTPTYPYITFQRIIANENNTLDGPSDVQNTIFQVDAWALHISEAEALRKSIRDALTAATGFTAIQLHRHDLYETKVKAHRCIADYSCWSSD